MGKLLPVILIAMGVGGGIGAGIMLRPSGDAESEMAAVAECPHGETDCELPDEHAEPDPHAAPDEDDSHAPVDDHAEPAAESGGHGEEPTSSAIEYVALRRQLVVPLVIDDRVASLVILSLSIEATGGNLEMIYQREPKLRDQFLRALFRHANSGGFDGVFTSGEKMNDLRSALDAAARSVLGSISHQVLVTEILRQEL